jgi:hypothetical protein
MDDVVSASKQGLRLEASTIEWLARLGTLGEYLGLDITTRKTPKRKGK